VIWDMGSGKNDQGEDWIIGSLGHLMIENQLPGNARNVDGPAIQPSYSLSLAGTKFNAFFTVPRSVMILSCKRVIA
jgi:hypothetical protein